MLCLCEIARNASWIEKVLDMCVAHTPWGAPVDTVEQTSMTFDPLASPWVKQAESHWFAIFHYVFDMFYIFLQRFIWVLLLWCFRLSRGSSTYINLCKQMCRREYVAGAIAAPLLQVYHTCPWHQVKDQTSWLFFCGQTDWKKWTCCTTFYSNIFHKMFRLRITATRNSFARPQMQESLHFHELLISKMIEVYFGFFMPVNCCSDNKPDHTIARRGTLQSGTGSVQLQAACQRKEGWKLKIMFFSLWTRTSQSFNIFNQNLMHVW